MPERPWGGHFHTITYSPTALRASCQCFLESQSRYALAIRRRVVACCKCESKVLKSRENDLFPYHYLFNSITPSRTLDIIVVYERKLSQPTIYKIILWQLGSLKLYTKNTTLPTCFLAPKGLFPFLRS